MLLELVHNNSAESYNFQVSFVEGGTHLLSEDYAKWSDPSEKKPKRPSPPAIPAVGHSIAVVSAQGAAQGGYGEDQTLAQPHPVLKCLLMTQALQGRTEGNPLLLFQG